MLENIKNLGIDGGLASVTYALNDTIMVATQAVTENPSFWSLETLTMLGLWIAPILVLWRFFKMIVEVKDTFVEWNKKRKNKIKGSLDL